MTVLQEIEHEILVGGADRQACEERARHFLRHNLLVQYETVRFKKEEGVAGNEAGFWERLKAAEAKNRQVLAGLLAELQAEGFADIESLQNMAQGYQSKLLHTAAHLLDGFFGIDVFFYNIEEDACQVSERLRAQIEANPAGFMLLRVAGGFSASSDPDRLATLRAAGTMVS